MPKGLPRIAKSLLNKARESSLLAVEIYNRPGTVFRSRAYVVLMQIAWLSLFLAIFHKRRIKPYYRRSPRRFEKIDGESKPWDLSECIGQYWHGQDDPIAQNLRFFIPLRNKIEHRELPELDIEIFGECQALLFNFEEMLAREFGERYAINESLAISLQFSRMRDAATMRSLRQLMKPLSRDISDYIAKFRSSLSDEIFGDMAYSYRVFMIPNIGNHRSRDSIAIQWVHYDPNNQEQTAQFDKLMAIVKEKHIPVVNPGKLKPGDVVVQVKNVLTQHKDFDINLHTKCWHYYGIRPPKNSANRAACKTEYCQYDEPHRDYVYTKEWVQFLAAELNEDQKYQAILNYKVPR